MLKKLALQIDEIKKPGIEEANSGMPEPTDKKENQNTKRKEVSAE